MRCVAGADVPPQADRTTVVDDDEIEHPVEVEVRERRAAAAVEVEDARGIGRLAEGAIRLSEEEVARVDLGVVRLFRDVALRDEEIDEAVVVDVRELIVPSGGWPRVAAGEGLGRVHSAPATDVAIRRVGGTKRERLQSIVGLAREKDFGVAVPGEVVARDTHPLYLHRHPSVVRRIERRRLTRCDAPELFLAVTRQVVLLVVAHAKIAPAGAVPVTEQHRESAPTRTERDRGCVDLGVGRRPNHLVVETEMVRVVAGGIDIVPERKGRQHRRALPGRTERRRGRRGEIQAPPLVRALETAAAAATKENVLTVSQDDNVRDPVAVDIDRVRAVHAYEIRCRTDEVREPKRAADLAVVPVQRGGSAPTREIEIRLPVAVAVEDGRPTADGVPEAAAIDVVDSRTGRLVDESRRAQRG